MNRPHMSMAEAARLAGCFGKHPFPTRRAAAEVAQRRPKRKDDRQRMEPYRCGHCRWWHIGRSNR